MSTGLATRSPPGSPFARESARKQQSRRSSIASSTASTSGGRDPFANADSSWYQPTSPASSGVSVGSPRSFYSAAPEEPFWQRQHGSEDATRDKPLDVEDDIGDLTITHNDHETPERLLLRDRKGKGRVSSNDYTEAPQLHSRSTLDDRDEESLDNVAESQRIEANLRKWAEREKLRRAKTRSRYAPPQKQAQSTGPFTIESAGTVTQLVRRMSSAGKRISTSTPGGHNRAGSRKLRSASLKDDIFGDGSCLVEVEEVELQPHRSRGVHSAQASLDSLSHIQPLSASSATFPERIQRAAKTGSRFIEDLEDQDIPGINIGSHAPQSYAQLDSNPATPIGSPTKSNAGTPRSAKKPLLRLADFRNSTLVSTRARGPYSPKKPESQHPSSGQSTPTVRSPMSYMNTQQYYTDTRDDPADQLVSPVYKPGDYGRQYSLDDEDDQDEAGQPMGWLEWIFCCGCFGTGVRLDDGDEQAGRTFPE